MSKEVLKELEKELINFFKVSWANYKDQATSDAKEFLKSSKNDLERWTKSLTKGEINKNDFEWLVLSLKDLGKLKALTQLGSTKIEMEKFLNGIVDIIVSTVFKLIPGY